MRKDSPAAQPIYGASKNSNVMPKRTHTRKKPRGGAVLRVGRGERPWTAHMFEKNRTALLLLAKERADWSLEVVPVRVGPRRSLATCGSFIVTKDGYDELVREFVDMECPDRHGVLYLQECGGLEIDLFVGLTEGGEVALDLLGAKGVR